MTLYKPYSTPVSTNAPKTHKTISIVFVCCGLSLPLLSADASGVLEGELEGKLVAKNKDDVDVKEVVKVENVVAVMALSEGVLVAVLVF